MNEVMRFLREHPIVLVILVAWIVGAIGNISKAAKKARERTQLPPRREARVARPDDDRPAPVDRPTGPTRPVRADEIAAEMRRILRGRNAPDARERPATEASAGDKVSAPEQPVRPPPSPPPLPGTVRTRNVVRPERAPQPVVPSTSSRRLQTQVDPHVGERITRRASVRSGHVGEHALGQLGGRSQGGARRRASGNRYALDDLKRVIVLNEILGPPLALRGSGGRDV